ncbi:hypothetical protein DXG01_010524 [Tephrocybe rancida]|nr:hypothetical protein DXG01_010524 [Tephrocybe rancida]
MPVTTTSAAIHIAPVVVKTFFQHGKRRAKDIKEGRETEDAKNDLFFDEAFHIVQAFIEMGTQNTVESLQSFTNTHVPAPPWAAVSPVLIPLSSCNRAADTLIDWFGPEELKHVVGGERWWQVRGLDGVDGEWITEKEYLDSTKSNEKKKKLSSDDANILRMDHLETVMLYVHGGGYFWGSINTHRYQIIRYARKFKGRAFAVNYRQTLHELQQITITSTYAEKHPNIPGLVRFRMYLPHPPPGALHKAVPASKIVMAGDSAGGGLCVTVLTVLRDLGLPMPAGAVLISPWVDLTHSFPSIMDNQYSVKSLKGLICSLLNTVPQDIIPQHGFLAKPSALWPLDPLPKDGGRVVPSLSTPPPKPGHSDTLKPTKSRVSNDDSNINTGNRIETQRQMLKDSTPSSSGESSGSHENQNTKTVGAGERTPDYDIDRWEPKPPKVLMDDPDAIPLELHAQIQFYAATEQLCHPLVSPILQGSLGNLPPLYILAGNDEVLRDEIIYIAHRAAHPSDYPARHGVLRDGHRQKENAERFTTPTKASQPKRIVGMCHVLTVFAFTDSAKCAYRSVAEFVKHVSHHDAEHLERNPFPELHRPPLEIPVATEAGEHEHPLRERATKHLRRSQDGEKKHSPDKLDAKLYKQNEAVVNNEVKQGDVDLIPGVHRKSEKTLNHDNPNQETDVPNVLMIRERVDIRGVSRRMEPPDQIKVLQIRPGQLGIIKEGPTRRWLEGQKIWDDRYEHAAKKAIKRRAKMEASANRMLDNARLQGLIHEGPQPLHRKPTGTSQNKVERIQDDRRWGPLDLDDERPPPSAIAKRRDTHEALALLKKSIYHTAPVTHTTVPKLRVSDAIRAALDPYDDPNKPPQQSVSEQQVHARLIPIHGLRLWDNIIRQVLALDASLYFGKETSKKALKSTKQLGESLNAIKSDL